MPSPPRDTDTGTRQPNKDQQDGLEGQISDAVRGSVLGFWRTFREVGAAPRCNLYGADLTRAHLRKANLTGAKGLAPPQLAYANGDETTQLPAGLHRPPQWTSREL